MDHKTSSLDYIAFESWIRSFFGSTRRKKKNTGEGGGMGGGKCNCLISELCCFSQEINFNEFHSLSMWLAVHYRCHT